MDTIVGHNDNSNIRNLRPPITTFSPSLWGDIFMSTPFDQQLQDCFAHEIHQLNKHARKILASATCHESIALVDTLERLGLAYHFNKELEDKIKEIYELFMNPDHDFDLHATAMAFRLLRQHQYQVSCDSFHKFFDSESNKFKETLVDDIEGLLSLYEAAHVRIHGEPILDNAVVFTSKHLKATVPQLESPLKDKVKHALEQPLHRGVPIIEIRFYISLYEQDNSRDDSLLKLAKVNFNYMQNMYKQDLCELQRWWNKFDLKTKLPYARDRLIECFLWGTAFHFEPEYSYVRKAIAKSIQMLTIMDDTYDNYSTLEENQLLTDCLERWDMNDMDGVPDFIKVVYQFIISIYEDYEHEAVKQAKAFAIPYFQETVKQLGRAYNEEQIWFMEKRMPSYEEFMNNSLIASCIYIIFLAMIPGLKSITKEDIDWLLSKPKLVVSTAKMGRCYEDLASHDREAKDGKMETRADWYIKYQGVSNQEGLFKLKELLEEGWKNINVEWTMITRSIPKEMVEQLANYVRMSEATYKNSEDGFTNPEKVLAPHIAAIFIEPIDI